MYATGCPAPPPQMSMLLPAAAGLKSADVNIEIGGGGHPASSATTFLTPQGKHA